MITLPDSCSIYCPYCGERIEITIDASSLNQVYTEDCQVCCRPMIVAVSADGDDVSVTLRREDD